LATVSKDNQPENAPIGFKFDGKVFKIFGLNLTATRKSKNIASGNKNAALVIDDLESVDPWKPRVIRIFGTADIVDLSVEHNSGEYLLFTPQVTWSWNIERSAFMEGKFLHQKLSTTKSKDN
jgi:pyridoxamine 5'-phosphate oxidase family protein